MRFTRILALATLGGLAVGTSAALADEAAIKARQAQFTLLAYNVGPLGAMAQGNMPYDAEVAQAAADNLVRLASLSQDRLWPEGSDNASVSGTRALPNIWADFDDFAAKFASLGERAVALQAVAGNGLDDLRAAIGPLAGACSACHQVNRAPQ